MFVFTGNHFYVLLERHQKKNIQHHPLSQWRFVIQSPNITSIQSSTLRYCFSITLFSSVDVVSYGCNWFFFMQIVCHSTVEEINVYFRSFALRFIFYFQEILIIIFYPIALKFPMNFSYVFFLSFSVFVFSQFKTLDWLLSCWGHVSFQLKSLLLEPCLFSIDMSLVEAMFP